MIMWLGSIVNVLHHFDFCPCSGYDLSLFCNGGETLPNVSLLFGVEQA